MDPASHITRNVPWSLLQRSGWRVQLAKLEVQANPTNDSGVMDVQRPAGCVVKGFVAEIDIQCFALDAQPIR
jgi:hypothetical protein